MYRIQRRNQAIIFIQRQRQLADKGKGVVGGSRLMWQA